MMATTLEPADCLPEAQLVSCSAFPRNIENFDQTRTLSDRAVACTVFGARNNANAVLLGLLYASTVPVSPEVPTVCCVPSSTQIDECTDMFATTCDDDGDAPGQWALCSHPSKCGGKCSAHLHTSAADQRRAFLANPSLRSKDHDTDKYTWAEWNWVPNIKAAHAVTTAFNQDMKECERTTVRSNPGLSESD